MKRILSILLLFTFLLPSITKLSIVVDFKINQDFIAKVLCVKKEEPMAMCNGKCYLKKQLNKTENGKSEGIPESLKQKVELFFVYKEFNAPLNNLSSPLKFGGTLSKLHLSPHLEGVFHPPQC